MENIQKLIPASAGYKCAYIGAPRDSSGFDVWARPSEPFDVIAWHIKVCDDGMDTHYSVTPVTVASFSDEDIYYLIHPGGRASINRSDEVYPSIESAMAAWRNSIENLD